MQIITGNLILHPFQLQDALFIIELLNSPGWLKFIGDRNVHNIDAAEKYLQNGPLKSYTENGFGLCMVESKDDRSPVGMCGLIKRANFKNTDIGFAFLPAYYGKGYGYEIASAVLDYAKDILKLKVVDAVTLENNHASVSLLKKLGMHWVEKIVMDNEELMLYRISF